MTEETQNSHFLRYYQSTLKSETSTNRSKSANRSNAPQELIAKIKRKKQELQELSKINKSLCLNTTFSYF